MSNRDREFATVATGKAPLPGYASKSPRIGLSADDVELGLNYCRWLHKKRFTDDLNKASSQYGLPPQEVPAFFKRERGEQIYDEVMREVKRNNGGVVLLKGDLAAVRDALIARKNEITRPMAAATKRAEAQLAGIQKFISNGKRTVRGLASSISVDRMGDIVEPRGGSWRLPIPLLWQHSQKDPIGWVRSIEVRKDGLWIEAEIAEGFSRADETWQMVQAGLLDSFSIGFRALKSEPLPGGGLRFTSWELLEVSVVSVPANPDAKISGSKLPEAKGSGSVSLAKRRGSVSLIRPGVKLLERRG